MSTLDFATLHAIHQQATAAALGEGSPFATRIEDVLGTPMPVIEKRMRSLREMLVDSTDRLGPLGYFTIDGTTLTRGELVPQVASVAAALRDKYGIEKGDRVAILAANCIEFAVAFWAITSLDAIVCAYNGWWTTDEIRYASELTEPKVLIGDAKRLERVAGVDQRAAAKNHSRSRNIGPPNVA